MKIAVVGANGFVGKAVCAHAQSLGAQVVPVSTQTHGFDGVTGLMSDTLPPDRAVGAVIYLAQSPLYRQMPDRAAHLWSVNVLSAIRAAEWARRCGAGRLVYASTGNVYRPSFEPLREDDPVRRDSWYALSKVQAEEALSLYGSEPSVTCARLFGVYGPHQTGRLVPNLIGTITRGDAVHLQAHPHDGSDVDGFKLSLTHVDDAASALCHLALNAGPAIVNLAAPDACSVRQIAITIGALLGVPPRFSTEAAPREGDLIANTDRLRALWPERFRMLQEGLETMIGAGTTGH